MKKKSMQYLSVLPLRTTENMAQNYAHLKENYKTGKVRDGAVKDMSL